MSAPVIAAGAATTAANAVIAATRTGGSRRRRGPGRGMGGIAFLFLLPNLLIFGTFTFLPMMLNGFYAVTGGSSIIPSQRPFVGLENFRVLFDCESYLDPHSCGAGGDFFWIGIHNTVFFVAVQVTLMVGIALATALVLNSKIIGRGFWRAVFFYPVMLSPVVVALIWRWILERKGALNALLEQFGIAGVPWLYDPSWAMGWTVFVSIWAHVGFYALILLAGLQAIPRDVYEAATMDAAGKWRTFTHVTLPLLLPNLLVVGVVALIKSFQIFDEVWVLTGGGPGSATTFVMQYIYETGFAEQPQRLGLAAAASLLLAAVVLVITLVQLRLSRRGMEV